MKSFQLHNPTAIYFGVGQIGKLAEIIPADTKLLLLYGGGSIKRNGVYDAVIAGLTDCDVVEFGGIEPNPVYETILQAASLARQKGVELILAVGGGSVVDAGKFLASIVALDPQLDPWDHWLAHGVLETLPVGAVLTLPATGSESNPVSVISHAGRGLKLPFANERARPQFAILDPDTMKSLDRRQLENGVVDAFTHVVEQYMTVSANAPVQYGFSETLLKVLIEWGPKLVEGGGEEARANVMWAANQALNGLIGAGVAQDWSTHMIGHAITAIYDVDHARTLSAVMPAMLQFKRAEKRAMLTRYAREVWDISGADEERVTDTAITKTREFFRLMGCPATLHELAPVVVETDAILRHLDQAGQTRLGEGQDIGLAEVRLILDLAA